MFVYTEQPFASPSEALEHFGVKGMRWGVRKLDKHGPGGTAAYRANKAQFKADKVQYKVDREKLGRKQANQLLTERGRQTRSGTRQPTVPTTPKSHKKLIAGLAVAGGVAGAIALKKYGNVNLADAKRLAQTANAAVRSTASSAKKSAKNKVEEKAAEKINEAAVEKLKSKVTREPKPAGPNQTQTALDLGTSKVAGAVTQRIPNATVQSNPLISNATQQLIQQQLGRQKHIQAVSDNSDLVNSLIGDLGGFKL